jgi:hypothetical protein
VNLLFRIIDFSIDSVNMRFGSFGNVWLALAAGNSRELKKERLRNRGSNLADLPAGEFCDLSRWFFEEK